MKLQDLKTLIPPPVKHNLEALYQDFCVQQTHGDVDQFVSYLYEQQIINGDTLREIHLFEPIEVTSLDAFSEQTYIPLGQEQPDGENNDNQLINSEDYDILELLGKGAMGLVHLAKDRDLQRKVAYKQLLGSMARNRGVLKRFLNEVQITAQLDHPNIVPIYSLDVATDGSLAYAMKLVKGKTLKELLQEARESYDQGQPPDPDHSQNTLLEHFLKVCDAMAYAHNKRVIHRDLKPANIMIGHYNEVYVMDWGIAKVYGKGEHDEEVELSGVQGNHPGDEDATQLGQVLGTPRYMSPQQAAGKNKDLDGRSDQFALGLILYEIMTLKPAFTAKSAIELLKRVLKADLENFETYHPKIKVAPEVKAIILKAAAQKPEGRYASVEDLATDLRRFLRGEAVLAQPDSPLRRILRWISKHRQATLRALMGVFLLSASVTIWSLYHRQQELAAAQVRENRLGDFLTRLARKTQHIDSEFLRFEGLLQKLSAAALVSLTQTYPSSERYYLDSDYQQTATQPPDFAPAARYQGTPLSTGWSVFRLAPNTSLTTVEPLIRQLTPLRHIFPQLLIESGSPQSPRLSASQARTQIATTGVPLVWAFVALEQGLHMAYPGKGGYSADYDPRQRPWYQQSLGKRDFVWGKPYPDALGQGMLVPCTLALYSAQERFLGVAGVELQLNYFRDHILPLEDVPALRNSYLLDANALPLAQINPEQDIFTDHPKALTAVQTAIQAGQSGYQEVQIANQHYLVAYYRLNSVGWYYAVVTDATQLFQGQP
jgi:serine/threonine protein kinase